MLVLALLDFWLAWKVTSIQCLPIHSKHFNFVFFSGKMYLNGNILVFLFPFFFLALLLLAFLFCVSIKYFNWFSVCFLQYLPHSEHRDDATPISNGWQGSEVIQSVWSVGGSGHNKSYCHTLAISICPLTWREDRRGTTDDQATSGLMSVCLSQPSVTAEKEKTEGATWLGRIIREQIERWDQVTALRFQTGGRHQKPLACLLASALVTWSMYDICRTVMRIYIY